MVAILDPRIKTRFYGKNFLNALPECRETQKLEEVHEFFNPKNRDYHTKNSQRQHLFAQIIHQDFLLPVLP